MNVIDTLPVDHPATDPRTLVLCSGDIASIPSDINLQYLVISGTPGDYGVPENNPHLIELQQLGVNVAALEQNYCRHDFRPSLPCWVSHALNLPDVHFRYLLAWEPALVPPATHRLFDVQYAFQALSRLEGYSSGSTAMLLLWPTVGIETQKDMFRMQFFSAVALAARSAWPTLYLMVPPELAADAAVWFATLKPLYNDPPMHVEPRGGSRASWPARLSQYEWPVDSGPMSMRQAMAVSAYTLQSYTDTNRALRTNDPQHPDFIQMQPLIEAIASGLAHLPNFAASPVERGIKPFPGISDLYIDGSITLELAFTSTSTRSLPFGEWKVKMEGALGKAVWDYSWNPNEREVLFDSAMTHLVTDVEYVDEGKSIVTSKESLPIDVGVRETHL